MCPRLIFGVLLVAACAAANAQPQERIVVLSDRVGVGIDSVESVHNGLLSDWKHFSHAMFTIDETGHINVTVHTCLPEGTMGGASLGWRTRAVCALAERIEYFEAFSAGTHVPGSVTPLLRAYAPGAPREAWESLSIASVDGEDVVVPLGASAIHDGAGRCSESPWALADGGGSPATGVRGFDPVNRDAEFPRTWPRLMITMGAGVTVVERLRLADEDGIMAKVGAIFAVGIEWQPSPWWGIEFRQRVGWEMPLAEFGLRCLPLHTGHSRQNLYLGSGLSWTTLQGANHVLVPLRVGCEFVLDRLNSLNCEVEFSWGVFDMDNAPRSPVVIMIHYTF